MADPLPDPPVDTWTGRLVTTSSRAVLQSLHASIMFLQSRAPWLLKTYHPKMEQDHANLSPEARALMYMLRILRSEPSKSTEEMRAKTDGIAALVWSDLPFDLKRETIDGVPTDIVRANVPRHFRSNGAVIHLHGGGYQAGRSYNYHPYAAELSHRMAGVDVIIPDYRLVPEADLITESFDDCFRVYKSAVEKYGAKNVVLVGDSAGGGCCANVLAMALKRGVPTPAALVLLSPMIDLSLSYHSYQDPIIEAIDCMITPTDIHHAATASLAGKSANSLPAADDRVLTQNAELYPPTLIVVGSHELLLGDSTTFAERLRRAGCPEVDVLITKGMCHVFPLFFRWAQEIDASLTMIANYARSKIPGLPVNMLEAKL